MKKQVQFRKWPAYSALSTFFWCGSFVCAQSAPAQSPSTQNPAQNPSAQTPSTQDHDNVRRADDRDANREELANFNRFLDSHRETAEQLRKDPSLVDNPQFVKAHPALQTYLQEHPAVREQLKQNPNAFMHQEDRYDRSENDRDRDATRRELANFNQFLDSHRETAEQLRKDPSLADNQQYLKDHPELQAYLQQHPAVQQELRNNPNGFMQDESRFDRNDSDRDREATRRELANFDQYLDRHREVAEQVRKNPSLVDNQEFLKDHPSLQSYLQDHPAVRQELKSNPNAFMREEARYDQHENDMNRGDRGRDFDRNHTASFGEFLGAHANINEQLSKDPSLAKRDDYLQDHPELRDYLNQHPEVRADLNNDPQNFMKSCQQFNANGQAGKPSSPAPTAQMPEPKPKQQ
jgi:hypothetical protein